MDTHKVPGRDFAKTYSPVIHNATFRLLLVIKKMIKLKHALFDVQVAFLMGALEDVAMYMEAPEGLENMEGHCTLLSKTMWISSIIKRVLLENYYRIKEDRF